MNSISQLLLFLALSLTVQAQQTWRLKSSSALFSLGNEAVFVTKNLSGPAESELKLVIFDARHCRMRVVANVDPKTPRSLLEIGRAEGALAVCNGGYFNPGKLTPVGLEISDGRRSAVFENGSLVGCLVVHRDKAALIQGPEFRDSPEITQFVQCNPWLVSGGAMVPLPAGEELRNRRTFILTDGEDRWAIGICNRMGLVELARMLVTPGIITEIKVKHALNLDGGPSTGLWCRKADGREFHEKPGWAVRNTISVIPRISK